MSRAFDDSSAPPTADPGPCAKCGLPRGYHEKGIWGSVDHDFVPPLPPTSPGEVGVVVPSMKRLCTCGHPFDMHAQGGGYCSICNCRTWRPSTSSSEAFDPVNHPKHYNNHPSGIEAIEVTEFLGFCCGNAFKYLLRRDLKGGIEDVKKAIWYIERAAKNEDPDLGGVRSYVSGTRTSEVLGKADYISSFEPYPFNIAMRRIAAYGLSVNATKEHLRESADDLKQWVKEHQV